MVNDSWLIRQLEAWPTRVDAERTIEVRHLMQEAAQSLRSLHSALQDAVIWHQNADKALSKQPPSADGQWRRMEHQEQASNLAALATQPATSQEGEEPTCEKCDRGVCVNPHYEDDDRLNRPAATPTPPTLSEDLRVLIGDIAWTADDINGRCGMTLENDDVKLLDGYFAALARAQGQAS